MLQLNWRIRNKLCEEDNKLRLEGGKFWIEGDKFWIETILAFCGYQNGVEKLQQ